MRYGSKPNGARTAPSSPPQFVNKVVGGLRARRVQASLSDALRKEGAGRLVKVVRGSRTPVYAPEVIRTGRDAAASFMDGHDNGSRSVMR